MPADEKAAADGLALIQFAAPLRPEWRAELEALGVQLLSYVPDDAFVTDLNGTPPGQVRELSFVEWLGPYRPEHKLHPALKGFVPPVPDTNAPDFVQVSVLLASKARPAEAHGARGLFTRVDQESGLRLGTILRGELPRARLPTLANSRAVLWIEPAPRIRLFDEVASRIVAGDGPTNQTLMQSLGWTGAGVTVAVADSGLDSGDTNSMHPDIAGRVKALFYYGTPGQLEDAADEHSHGTHVAGIVAGNGALGERDENGFLYGLGVAPGAGLIAQRIFDGAGGYAPPPSFEQLTRDARRAGADIGSNSWGDDTQGQYDLSAMEFDELVRDCDTLALGDQPYILEFSAGNAGPGYRTVGSPAVAKNVIATGAAQNDRFNLPLDDFAIYADGRDTMADFSSRGPCADGRIKPDLVAPGTWIASLRSVYADDNNAWWPISENYMYQGGTSQAGPHVSGAAAVFVQYWRANHAGAAPSPALVKAALINSAADLDDFYDTDPTPNDDEGWGRVDLPALIAPTADFDFTDQSVSLTNGGVFEKRILIGSANEPLRITLAYTDEPGLPAALIALVNDLDLEVVSPDGHTFRGNRFADGESIPDASLPDTINNVEGVYLSTPAPGEYIVRVRGSRVVADVSPTTPPIEQDFALVISGDFGTPGVGIVTFNRRVYRAPDTIALTLVDYDLAGQSTANVLVRSGAEPAGELRVLNASGSSGIFTGSLATATSPSVGVLLVAHNNTIEAVYADASPAANRIFTAQADLQPPVISGVAATNQFGQVSVMCTTDEPATVEVYFGSPAPNLSTTNSTLETDHEAALFNIQLQAAIKYFVVAEDEAGNRSTNNNGGSLFAFTNATPSQILLIDSFASYAGFIEAPPLAGYTNALNQLGVNYRVFDATGGAIPTQAQLNSNRCVIWRISDLEQPNTTLAQRITNYVNGGGSLLLASMEAVSRFTEAGLASFNTGTLRVQSYVEDQPVDEIAGAPGEAVGMGINTVLDYTPYEVILTLVGVTDPSDWIVPTSSAASAILSSGHTVGLRAPKPGVDLPGRVVFLSFPLDAVPEDAGIGNNRAGLLRNILNFLAPPPNTSTLTLDSDVYSVPGRAIVEVEDNDLQGTGSLTVNLRSPQHANQFTLSLLETSRRGFFRGEALFVATNLGLPGTFLVNANDTVIFEYADVSAGVTNSTTATIETNAPALSDVAIEPGYLEAIVSWTTTEDTDALVQYSESPISFPVNFTAYDPTPGQDHEVFVSGLRPGTTYYVRVTSRDRAGNATTDDNFGTNYVFTTLTPRGVPWFDDMETNSVEWSTFASTDAESEWTRGAPGGGESAFSGTNCWGSNLGGGSLSQTETYLISPGIFLGGGNKATLRFWHNYDFFPQGDFDFHLAAIEIITNVTTAPVLLYQVPADFSFGWEEFEYDLTPFMGNVVYIVWYHFYFSIDARAQLGWLVDDVSITTETIVPGTISVTNNLWQATWALSGPSNRNGRGRLTAITNAAPGNYVLEFGDVAYFNTPPPQTNVLTGGGDITFTGSYTFPDANTNGIPDGWELASFGNLSPARTRTTDTDGDGQSDYAEFVAGTDPNNPPPPFQLTAEMTNGLVRLSWPTITNFNYRVLAATTPTTANWSAYSGWMIATGTNKSFLLPTPTNGAPTFFRVEAASATGIPATLRGSISRQSNGSVRLDWPTAPNHGYRVLGSTNLVGWLPFSDWLLATNFSSSLTLPPLTNGAPNFFRLEAAP